MLKDWKAFIPKIGESMKALRKHSPATFDGYRMLHEAGAQTGHLDAKTREGSVNLAGVDYLRR